MIKLKLSFGKDYVPSEYEVQEGELLKRAIERVTDSVPLGEFKREDIFNVVVNGHIIDYPFWDKITLKKADTVLITPKIKDGEFGQVFKQFLLVAITIVAGVLLTPAGGATVGSALLVAGVTIAASLALNALIPPPVQDVGPGGTGIGGVDDSQMYAISGQSNQMKRLGIVPKVYGTHRVFPTLATTPYTELSVNPATGEVVQYLVAVYDFGLGTPQLSDIRIGDTPLTTDSFQDFQYNLVDINRPDVYRDKLDQVLKKEFKLYQGDRDVTSLAIDMSPGVENVQTCATNPLNLQQEFILDFVCPRGLFGYDSSGSLKQRIANLSIEFALVGSTDWKAYNDTSAVDNFDIIGGTDTESFQTTVAALVPTDPLFGSYYDAVSYQQSNMFSDFNYITYVFFRGGNGLLVPSSSPWQVGQAVTLNYEFVGNIIDVQTVVGRPEFKRIVLDRSVLAGYNFYTWRGKQAYQTGPTPPPIVYGPSAETISTIKSYNSISARANIVGARSNPVYASFRFKPKVIGRYQVRVRRLGSEGDYSQQKADDVTWGGLTTNTPRPPVLTDKRHVFMELRIRATNQLNGNIQNLSAVASQSLEVYDPDTQTWSRQITNNPAWVFVDLLTGEINKKRVSVDRLHLESIVAWANYCAEVPTPPPSQTYLFPRFQTNFVLDYEGTLQEVLFQICGAAQASLNVIDGKYGVLVDRLKTTPVQIFTPRNSSGFSSTRFYGPRPDGVKVKFIDPNLDWETSEVIVYDNGFDATNAENFDEMTSFACTNNEQAWRFGRYMIAQNRLRQETMNLQVDFEHLVCSRGDYVQISQDVMEVGGRPARVKSVNGSEFVIDDHLDIDPDIDYGVTHRAADGSIATNHISVTAPNTFTLLGNKVIFRGQDTSGQTLDTYFRYGGVPAVIGSQVKSKALAISIPWDGVKTTYVLPATPISDDDLCVWLDGDMRTEWTRTGTTLTFPFDTSGQVLDCILRKSSPDVVGSPRKILGLVGFFDGSDTIYDLPETPISDDDTIGFLNGFFRTDFTVVGDQIVFFGQDTTGQDFDVQYRYSGGASLIGTAKRDLAVVGVWDGTDTTYTLSEEPTSEHDLMPYLNGIMRSDYTQGLPVPAVGDLVVIGEMTKIVFDCIVKSISPNDDLSAQLVLVERANEIFDYESSSTLPDYDPQLSNTANPVSKPPKAVTNLTLLANTFECAQTQSGYNYYVEFSWDIPPGSVYEFFEIWYDDGRGYRSVANTSSKQFHVDIDQDRLGTEHGVKVVAVAASGNKLQLIAMPEIRFTPVVKNVAPSDVDGLSMNITNQVLQLSWNSISDCDVAKYEVRFSTDTNDVWEASVPLQVVDRNVNSISVQARTGLYLIKAIDFAGNKSATAARAITTIPNLFDLNVIQEFQDAPTFPGELQQTELLGEAVILTTAVAGTVDNMQFTPEGFYVFADLLDLGDIYSVRLASLIRADGYRFGELMSSWEHLSSVDHLSSSDSDDWNVVAEYRATNEILAMSDWVHLSDVDHLNEGVGQGFTDWRPISTIGDATGRVFQFRVKLESLTPNVTPRLFDARIKADMPDRVDNFENLVSTASGPFQVTYAKKFNGPAPSPNVQITVENPQKGDYWVFSNKDLEGFQIQFYDETDTQVVRTFDVQAKGYGSRHTVTI